jgi:hypothetical protein
LFAFVLGGWGSGAVAVSTTGVAVGATGVGEFTTELAVSPTGLVAGALSASFV